MTKQGGRGPRWLGRTILTTETDLALILPDRVGTLAQTLGILARAGIDIRGHSGFPAWAGEGILHLVVDDPIGRERCSMKRESRSARSGR